MFIFGQKSIKQLEPNRRSNWDEKNTLTILSSNF